MARRSRCCLLSLVVAVNACCRSRCYICGQRSPPLSLPTLAFALFGYTRGQRLLLLSLSARLLWLSLPTSPVNPRCRSRTSAHRRRRYDGGAVAVDISVAIRVHHCDPCRSDLVAVDVPSLSVPNVSARRRLTAGKRE